MSQAKLQRTLGIAAVFGVAAGAMISSGLFVLPGLAYAKAGPGVVLSYLLASIMVLPSVLSKAELATALPRAGGTYFFVERSLGPVLGLFGGLAGWFSLALKSGFAVLGIALFIETLLEQYAGTTLQPWHVRTIAAACGVAFTALNAASVHHTARFQVVLVVVLLAVLGVFVFFGFGSVQVRRFEGFLGRGWGQILATAGLVFVSYGGVTKVASVAEEVRRPGRVLPQGMVMAWLVVSLLYVLAVGVTVGVLEGDLLAGSSVPLSAAARQFLGNGGFFVLGVAAMLAYVTTANGGVLAASRAPMAMSRDGLLPPGLARVSARLHTPVTSVLLTGGFMVVAVVLLDLELLVKTASTLMILLFLLDNVSVIVMRESRIQTYRPAYRSPGYPFVHIAAIGLYVLLILDMGFVPLATVGVFVIASIAWYFLYVRRRIRQVSAAMHVVERVTDRQLKTVTLEDELRDIILERDAIVADRFDRLVQKCEILDIPEHRLAEEVFGSVASILSRRLGLSESDLFERLVRREAESSTVITPGLAIPHVIVPGEHRFELVLVRAVEGISYPNTDQPVHAMFVLAGSKDERNYHLRALMAIAHVVQGKDFKDHWRRARDAEGLRNLVLLSTRPRDVQN